MTLEMTYFRAELVQLIVSRSDSELQRYGMKRICYHESIKMLVVSNCMQVTGAPSRYVTATHRRRLHGGDGGDRPHGQKVVGAMPPSRPHRNFVMSIF